MFKIQVSNPAIRDRTGVEREDLSSAIVAVFPETTEDAILFWNWLPVRINYNCDLSTMMEDLLLMIHALLRSDSGSHRASFGANTFRARWSLQWVGGILKIESTWDSIAGSYEDLLNSRSALETTRDEFLSEWKSLLRKVIDAIEHSGIVIIDQEQVEQLRSAEAAIRVGGRIYEPR